MTSLSRKPVASLIMGTVLATILAGCGKGGHKDAGASPAPQADGTFDESLAAEYDALPSTVLIGVKVDADGHDVMGSGELRVPAEDVAAIENDDAAWATFSSGRSATVAASADELDRDTSTQSWATPAKAYDYASYQPQAYSSRSAGQSYTYSEGTRYQANDYAVYVYRRPQCFPPYCRPNNGNPGTPGNGYPGTPGNGNPGNGNIDQALAAAFAKYNVRSIGNDEWYRGTREQIDLGARLFGDTILSSKGDVSCASCHSDRLGTASIYSLGPTGPVLGGRKKSPFVVNDLLGRNAPPLYNLGHKSYTNMFWDGRVYASSSEPSGFVSPAGDMLPLGLANALAAQALFPLIADTEMGCGASSGMKAVLTASPISGWSAIITRVLARPDYKAMFRAAYPMVTDPTIAHLVNAIAAYESDRWRADNTPFDRYVRGDKSALTPVQKIGASYFYGKANCASCHAGILQTDHLPHAIGLPQWGPGVGDGASGNEDYGVGRITGQNSDRYKFRTPTLRNVAVTGPWGHDGAYRSLRQFVMHYTDPKKTHDLWQPSQVVLPPGFAMNNAMLGGWNDQAARSGVRAATEVQAVPLSPQEIDALIEFLTALTDKNVARNPQALIINP